MPDRARLQVYDGTEVEVEPLAPLDGGGVRVEIDAVDGPRWRVEVNSTGNDLEVLTSWNASDELADVDLPAWVDDVLLQLQRGA